MIEKIYLETFEKCGSVYFPLLLYHLFILSNL